MADIDGIPDRVRQLMGQRGIIQKELAELVDRSQSTISNLLNGNTRKIDVQLLNAISKEFGVTIAWLVGEEETPKVKRRNGVVEKAEPTAHP